MPNKNSDIFKFLGLFALSIVFRYFTPIFLGDIFFTSLLFVFLVAKQEKNYFWVIYFWLLFNQPGYLFSAGGAGALPFISVPGLGREIFYNELFAFVVIFKTLYRPLNQNVFYKKHFTVIIIYAVILLIYGFLIGTSLLSTLKAIRYFIPLLLILFLPKIIPYNTVNYSIRLMFVTVLIFVFAQFVDIVLGSPLASYLGESSFRFSGREVDAGSKVFDINEGVVRTIYGPFVLLFSLGISLVFLLYKKDSFKSKYLISIAFLSFFSIFLSSTRGWILGSIVIIIAFFINDIKKLTKTAFIGILFLFLIFLVPQLNNQFTLSFDRVLTIASLLEGDMSASGSLSRITERGPRVMNKFYESPVFGFGFSDEFYDFVDGHVGNQSLLLNGGVFGYLLYLYFLFYILAYYYRKYHKTKNRTALIFLATLLGLFIIHSSSRMIFGYSLSVETAISLGMFFFISDYFINYSFNSGNKISYVVGS